MVRPWRPCLVLAAPVVASSRRTNDTTLATVTPAGTSTNNNTIMPLLTTAPMTKIRTITTKVATSTSTIWPKPAPTPVYPSTKDCYDRWDLCRSACLIWSWFTMGISCFKCLEDQKCHL